MIGVLNYNAGNLTSVESALRYIDAKYTVSQDPDILIKCDKLIFPGVGDAKFAMETLKSMGNDELLHQFVQTGKPLFGICLGSQIIFDHSQERDTPCLGLIPGNVKKFSLDGIKSSTELFKVPHMGWNEVQLQKPDHPLFKSIQQMSSFYFVHSYYIDPQNQEVVAGTTDYAIDFCSAVIHNNICATQFHPEKSGKVGLKILSNFCNGREW